MTRKQAMLVLLGVPAGAQDITSEFVLEPVTSISSTLVPPKTESVALRLCDKDTDSDEYWQGIDSIEVYYRGKTKRFTAAEIWEALG